MPALTFAEAADWFEQSAQDLEYDTLAAERASVEQGLEIARNWSAGPLSTKRLRQLDHPYAKRHGFPQRDPGLINRQTGVFAGSWVSEGPAADADDGAVSTLYNTDPKAEKWLEPGTRYMFARPVDARIGDGLEEPRAKRIEAVLDQLTS